MTDEEAKIEYMEGQVVEEDDKDRTDPSRQLIRPDHGLPPNLHILPVSGRPFFPGQGMPIVLPEDPWLETVEKISETPDHVAGILLTREDAPDIPQPADFYTVGTVVRIHKPTRAPGLIQLIAEGLGRFRVTEWLSETLPLVVHASFPKAPHISEAERDQTKAYGLAIINTVKELLPLNPLYGEELKMFLTRFDLNDPSPFADFAANLTSSKKEELQEVLETVPLLERLQKVLLLVKNELDVAKIQAKIRQRVDEKMSEQQRNFFLRQQLEEIQRQLGISKDDRTAEVERFRQRLDTLELPEKAQTRIDQEMDKFSVLEIGSPEYAVTRNYLDWLTSLPWKKYSKDKLNLRAARRVLDRDHDGLDDVKERIIEFLAVGAYKGEISGSILLLVGPPGVGKTSIGRSVAEALGRQFHRFSLGGMRDEAEIKGHRRTYIGALPGKFIQAMKETGLANPVIMLDEIDKVGASYQGDPAAALLEVLDPEQNVDFLDHYLDVPFDLSKVMFICTANQLDTIPAPLLDRMETIHLAGYITAEKVKIARNHLWPKQLAKAGIEPTQLKITEAALEKVIEGYAREAGVRNLEKQLGRIIRKAVVRLLRGAKTPIRIGISHLEEHLGQPRFHQEKPAGGVGVVTGLAWTSLGGVTLNVEATRVHSSGRGFKQTGQLGAVMTESSEIAYSYVTAHLDKLGGKAGFFDMAQVHLHVPEGATPKDGPSAGITMATALLSLARGERIRRPLAMTGELTLTGQVLPVGGIREKLIAARRVGISELIFSERNRKDFEELPAYLRKGMTAHFAKLYPEVAEFAFRPPAKKRAKKKRKR